MSVRQTAPKILALACLGTLAFMAPALWLRHGQAARPVVPGARAQADPGLPPGADSALSTLPGAAQPAARALLDKVMAGHAEMSDYADQERKRIAAMEPELAQLERDVKDSEARATDLSLRLERMRADAAAGGTVSQSEYEHLQGTYNAAVAEHNSLVADYDEQFTAYKKAAASLDSTIAQYEKGIRDKLPVPR